jgi:hypothetical protein
MVVHPMIGGGRATLVMKKCHVNHPKNIIHHTCQHIFRLKKINSSNLKDKNTLEF